MGRYDKTLAVILSVGLAVIIQVGAVFAHSGENTDGHPLALTNPMSEEQASVPKPNTWNFVRLRLTRVLTRSIERKIVLTDELTTMRLLAAQSRSDKLDEAFSDFVNEKSQIAALKIRLCQVPIFSTTCLNLN